MLRIELNSFKLKMKIYYHSNLALNLSAYLASKVGSEVQPSQQMDIAYLIRSCATFIYSGLEIAAVGLKLQFSA